MMTRQHFETTALMISSSDLTQDAKEEFARGMANIFEKSNPRFDKDKFLRKATEEQQKLPWGRPPPFLRRN